MNQIFENWYRISQSNEHYPANIPDNATLPQIEIEPYGRFWAVTLNQELLCVTVYKRGALAVKELVERLCG
jgi:hypothetical protein